MKQYYEIFRDLREDHDLTQGQVAKVLGTTQQAYSRYELGINEMPVRHLRALCQFYQVSADYVLSLHFSRRPKVSPPPEGAPPGSSPR